MPNKQDNIRGNVSKYCSAWRKKTKSTTNEEIQYPLSLYEHVSPIQSKNVLVLNILIKTTQ